MQNEPGTELTKRNKNAFVDLTLYASQFRTMPMHPMAYLAYLQLLCYKQMAFRLHRLFEA